MDTNETPGNCSHCGEPINPEGYWIEGSLAGFRSIGRYHEDCAEAYSTDEREGEWIQR